MDSLSHRHAVALPVLIIAGLMVFAMHTLVGTKVTVGSRMATVTASSDARVMTLRGGVTAMLQPGSTVQIPSDGDQPILTQGEIIVAADMFGSVRAGDVTASIVHGSMVVLHDTEETTVVALAGPVLIEEAGKALTLPPGYQYRVTVDQLLEAPSSWISERARALSTGQSPQLFDGIAELTPALHESLQTTLALQSGRTDLSSLLGFAMLGSGQPMTTEVTQRILNDIHESQSSRTYAALTLAQIARVSGKALPEAATTLWKDAVIRLASIDTTLALQALALGADAALLAERRGYPLQSSRWQEAVRSSAPILASVVSTEHERARIVAATDTLRSAKMPLQASLTQDIVTVPPVSTPASDIDPSELLQRTRVMLLERGVLQTPDTDITLDALNPGMARVRGIFKEEDGVLTPYTFSYDPVSDVVSHIVRGAGQGEALPNAVSGEVFFL